MDRSEETIDNEPTPDQISEGQNGHPMDAFLEEEYQLESPKRGEVRTGTIARITETDILVDISYKSEGVIASRELEQLSEEERAELIVGTEVLVYVLRAGEGDGTIILSLNRAEEERGWLEAERLLETKEIYEGIVAGYNKGGLIVKLGRLRGFIPASQVSLARRWRAEGETPEQRWGKMVDEPIVAKVIEVDRRRNRLILSERAAAREARDLMKERLITQLKPGEERTGYVISLADFGAFVDIGGADGLVHTSEISWRRISHPREVLKVGQEVKVKVLSVDEKQKRISLSLRELEADPWDAVVETYKEGQLVEGTVTKLTKFGAFATLKGTSDYELEGLIHISELSDRHIVHPREIVSEEETLTLRIIRVDRERRRIGLSLKRVDSPEYAELDWQAAMQELQPDPEAAADLEEGGISFTPAVDGTVPEAVAEEGLVEEDVEGEPDEAVVEMEIEEAEVSVDHEAEEAVEPVEEEITEPAAETEEIQPEDAVADEDAAEVETIVEEEDVIAEVEPEVEAPTHEEVELEAEAAETDEGEVEAEPMGEIEEIAPVDEVEAESEVESGSVTDLAELQDDEPEPEESLATPETEEDEPGASE
ncbi:MAG: S1 RNA-binding domain-containing protein [Anaerolineales bacterium]|nr:S1 RNA-binding domain-containing protein [Anaerolineales bacterium]